MDRSPAAAARSRTVPNRPSQRVVSAPQPKRRSNIDSITRNSAATSALIRGTSLRCVVILSIRSIQARLSYGMNATALTIAAATAGLAAGGYAYAAMWPTSQIFGHTIVAGHDPNEIALTYDDGPNPVYTPQLLDLLDRYAVKVSFFLIGNHVQRHPQL